MTYSASGSTVPDGSGGTSPKVFSIQSGGTPITRCTPSNRTIGKSCVRRISPNHGARFSVQMIDDFDGANENLFSSCWARIDRLTVHQESLVSIWNEFIDEHPLEVMLRHEGNGVHLLEVGHSSPFPAAFSAVFGEWLFNARTCLDYIIWATASYVSGVVPPTGEDRLQFPIYDTYKSWCSQLHRLEILTDHHREMLLRMQPFNGDRDANYLGTINRLARLDRHRRLTVGTATVATVSPIVEAPAGSDVQVQWGARVFSDGWAQLARISISPWTNEMIIRVNPRTTIDPEIAEWAQSPFWSRVRFGERLRIIQLFLRGEIAAYEYDCTGSSRNSIALTDAFKTESDKRGHFNQPRLRYKNVVEWGERIPSKETSLENILEVD